MSGRRNALIFAGIALVLGRTAVAAEKVDTSAVVTRDKAAILWRDPQNLPSRNLFYGSGGVEHQPAGDYSFVKEDLGGTNPKFVVRDAKGVKWNVKLGIEAQPEVAASRLIWAAGYFADEDYLLPEIHVTGLPAHLHRGQKYEDSGGNFHNARLKRQSNHEKAGRWKWRENPFLGTREFNGLRTLVAVINDWDVKDANTAIREEDGRDGPRRVFYISDLGASFGTAGIVNPRRKSKGDLASYQASVFIRKTKPEFVDFDTPRRPSVFFLFNPHSFFSRLRMQWVGRDIPRSDAHWAGELLGRLSLNQIRDAFRAAGYAPDEVEGFARIVKSRIEELNKL